MGYLWGTYGVPMGYLWVPSVVTHSRHSHIPHYPTMSHSTCFSWKKNMVKNIRESDEIGRGPAAVLSHVKRHGSNHKHESGTL